MFKYASNYRADPAGWIANQGGHIGAGVWLTFVAAYLWHHAFGEFPVRLHLWAVIASGYMAWEIFRQGWNGADTLEDWIFVTVYGAGCVTSVFREVSIGDSRVFMDISEVAPWLLVATVHLAIGVLIRLWQVAVGAGFNER